MRAALLLATLLLSGLAQSVELDLNRYKGKVVYVDFWASWCAPCRASFPWMEQLHQDLKDDGLVVLAINTGDNPDDAARFLQITNPSFNIITDPEGTIAAELGVKGMPFSVLFDRNGERVSSHTGFRIKQAPELRKAIEAQLKDSK